MCTLIILHEYVEGYPLIVAANRDELYDRQSNDPESELRAHGASGSTTYIRPIDRRGKGTWIGVAQDGWFVGLTNQDDGKHFPDAKSRGPVALECLYASSHSAVAKKLVMLEPTDYNPFNLVFGRPGALFLTRFHRGIDLEMEPIPAGVTVISNDCAGTLYDYKVNHARNAALDIDPKSSIAAVMNALYAELSHHSDQHPDDPYQSLCVHDQARGFGTRSTSIIAVSNRGTVEYWYSDGHPCQSTGLVLAGHMLHLEPEPT